MNNVKKLVGLGVVESAKVLDPCVEGEKLLEPGTGAVYNKAVKGVKVSKGAFCVSSLYPLWCRTQAHVRTASKLPSGSSDQSLTSLRITQRKTERKHLPPRSPVHRHSVADVRLRQQHRHALLPARVRPGPDAGRGRHRQAPSRRPHRRLRRGEHRDTHRRSLRGQPRHLLGSGRAPGGVGRGRACSASSKWATRAGGSTGHRSPITDAVGKITAAFDCSPWLS